MNYIPKKDKMHKKKNITKSPKSERNFLYKPFINKLKLNINYI